MQDLSTPGSSEYVLPVALSISVTPESPSAPVAQSISVIPVSPFTRRSSVLCQAEWRWWWETDFPATLGKTLLLPNMLLHARSRDLLSCRRRAPGGLRQVACGEQCCAGGMWHLAGGGSRVAGGRNHAVYIIVWTLSLAHPPWQDLTMPHGHGVENCKVIFCSKGRQFKLGESRSPTQVFQRNRLPASHRLWAYVCTFGLGLMELMARAMAMAIAIAMAMAIVMVLVIVIIVQEVLRQVGWLHQSQHQSFHRLRAFH